MMNKKILISFLAITMMLFLGGCSLAKEEVSPEGIGNEDYMIGLLITEGNRGIMDGTDETMTLEELKEANKVYAVVDKKNSGSPADWEVSFPGIDGISFFIPEFHYGEGEFDSFVTVVGSDEMSDMSNHMNVTDEGESREISGTIYVARETGKEYIYYMNPVYQTAAGEIYVTQGNGLMGSEADGIGALGSWNAKEEKETTIDGETKVQGFSVDVTFEMMFMPIKIRVHQMDMEHHILDSQEYEPGKMPEEVKCEKETVYVVVETERVNLDKEIITEREMGTADDEGKIIVETFYKGDYGALRKQQTTFINY